MRYLISGGAGFIGAHLCRALLARGHFVYCLDDFSTGERGRIAALVKSVRFRVVEQDVRKPVDVDVDRIMNLACPASPRAYGKDRIRTLTVSVFGTLNMLELAERRGARLLQASTSEVYGDPLRHPQDEGYFGNVNPVGPRACYDEGKRVAETLVTDHALLRGVDGRIVRIFNTYGPGMSLEDGRVVPNVVSQALRDAPITIYGDGLQTRAFCYVDDLVDGLIRAIDTPDIGPEPINLGQPEEVTVLALTDLVVELTGSRSARRFMPAPVDDPVRRLPDVARAAARLGWRPKTGLRDGLAATIADVARALAARDAAALADEIGETSPIARGAVAR